MKNEQQIKDGGQAFAAYTGHGHQEGMTLRDYFAGQAMVASVAQFFNFQRTNEDYAKVAQSAYLIADAMIEAREKGGNVQ